MGFEPEIFQVSDEQLAGESLGECRTPMPCTEDGSRSAPATYPAPAAFLGISLERLKREGPVRLNVPKSYAPFAEGNFGTPSGKCEFYSETMARMGLDPLPNYTPPYEDPQTRPDLAARFPLQLLSPPAPAFLNSTFVNVASLRR